ncbi:unnamed protein product [Notodromas monacha]|uniref:Locomotion-related protein Hikaru genki n=1 Tax=Notodromas monacha TaxID=399045 RepID=A0A7R9BRU4_9CRUS|nr:unnamed protein product [Notodromas monacha]CAG0920180.1 unnamed protein product [Notodromas monacha]
MGIGKYYMIMIVAEILSTSRCVDIGKYSMTGSSRRKCVKGEWVGKPPTCLGLSQEYDYALERPPTILFRHQLGPIAQSNDGKLIVYPGTILHLECLWLRKFGNPKWVISHKYRDYPQNWTTDENRNPNLEYRLTIYHAQKDDSGTFTCETPNRHQHGVQVVVSAVHCPELPIRPGLVMTPKNSHQMMTKVFFSCENGNSLVGTNEISCLPSGNWSAPVPDCQTVKCPPMLNTSTEDLVPGAVKVDVRVEVQSQSVGGKAFFSCPESYGLRGPTESVCRPDGFWSRPFPICTLVTCEAPAEPVDGYIQPKGGAFRAGETVRFFCAHGYMVDGQPIITCQENGKWSRDPPQCVKACTYPGTIIDGTTSLLKYYYSIGETVTFDCGPGLTLSGAQMLRCLPNGQWSNGVPQCVPIQ